MTIPCQVPVELLERIARATVAIECSDQYGSGIAVSKDLVLTCKHVVKDGRKFKVRSMRKDGSLRTQAGTLNATDPKADFALLKVPKLDVEVLRLATLPVPHFMDVAVASASEEFHGLAFRATTCGLDGNAHLRIVGGATMRGCSGGPVVDYYGSLISIVKAIGVDGDFPVSGLTLAEDPYALRKFLRRST